MAENRKELTDAVEPLEASADADVTPEEPKGIEELTAHVAYRDFLHRCGQDIPEIESLSPELLAAGDVLIDSMQLDTRFFGDNGRVLLFTALVHRLISSKTDDVTRTAKDGLKLMYYSYRRRTGQDLDDAHARGEVVADPSQALLYTIEQFTDADLSRRLRRAIDDGLLDMYIEDAGDSSGNDPFEVRVLSVGNAFTLRGISRAFLDEWSAGLQARHKKLVEAGGSPAAAWAIRIAGRKILCVHMPTAERLLDPAVAKATRYHEPTRRRDLSLVAHERVHLLGGGLTVDGRLGLTLEELRAEQFSGHRLPSYMDAKWFSEAVYLATGNYLSAYMWGKPNGGEAYDMCAGLARDLGVDRMAEIMMTIPADYGRGGGVEYVAQTSLASRIGGYDGVLKRIVDRQVAADQADAMYQRIDERVTPFIAGGNLDAIKRLCDGLRNVQGLSTLADLFMARAIALLQERKQT